MGHPASVQSPCTQRCFFGPDSCSVRRNICIDGLSPLADNPRMQKTLPLSILFASVTVLTSQADLVFQVGRDDNDWPFGDGGGPNTSFVQENGVINPLPGSANNPEAAGQGDNDYYFAGVYTTVIPSNGIYSPLGVVAANEEGAERAFAAADNDLRYHFNLDGALQPNDTLSITFDALNLHDGQPDSRYGVELYFNNVLVMPQVIIRAAQLDQDFTSAQFSLASVNAQTGSGADNIVSLRGINYNAEGGGNWMGVDYVQLDSQVVPEPSAALMAVFGAVGLTPFLRRRRS